MSTFLENCNIRNIQCSTPPDLYQEILLLTENEQVYGLAEVLRLLMRKGKDPLVLALFNLFPRIELESKELLLMDAVSVGSYQVASRLLERGADPNGFKLLSTAIQKAAGSKRDADKILDLLLEKGAKLLLHKDTLYEVITANRQDLVEILLQRGIKVDTVALCTAVHSGLKEMLLYLLGKKDADVSMGAALYRAISMGNDDMIKILLQQGAVPDDADCKCAVLSGKPESVKCLLDHGVDVQKLDKYDPLTWKEEKDVKITILLLEHGGDFSRLTLAQILRLFSTPVAETLHPSLGLRFGRYFEELAKKCAGQ